MLPCENKLPDDKTCRKSLRYFLFGERYMDKYKSTERRKEIQYRFKYMFFFNAPKIADTEKENYDCYAYILHIELKVEIGR